MSTCLQRSILLVFLLLTGSAAAVPVNVVFIVSDDGGYSEFGFQDARTGKTTEFKTPHLDALAAESIVFDQGYVSGTVCSPSRAGFLTGRYQQRLGYEYNITNDNDWRDGMPTWFTILPERFKELGYSTMVAGKWHIGSETAKQPQNRGVDTFYGLWGGSRPYFQDTSAESDRTRRIKRNTTNITWWSEPSFNSLSPDTAGKGRHLTDAFGDEVCRFITDHAADPGGFFVYLPFTSPHGPYDKAKQQDIDEFSATSLNAAQKRTAAMIYALDRAVGLIRDRLDDPNQDGDLSDSVADNTVVLFFNDNGGATTTNYVHDNTPLRGHKSSTWEGGIRVPFLLKAPGLTPSTYPHPVITIDLFPTLMAAIGADQTTPTDGVNLLPYLDGSLTALPHDILYWRQGNKWAVRQGEWKLVRPQLNSTLNLYRLNADGSGEQTNRIGAEPEKASALQNRFDAWDARNDKPRWKNELTVNRFDHFVFRPGQGTATGPNLMTNGGLEQGTQQDTDSRYSFVELDDWTNDGANNSNVAANDTEAYAGTFRAVITVGRVHRQVTSHLLALGDRYTLTLVHRGFSGWDDGGATPDTIDVELIYEETGGTVQVLSTHTFAPIPDTWNPLSHTFPAINIAAAEGRPVGLRFRSQCSSGEFASFDEVALFEAGTAGPTTLPWSTANAWENAADPGSGVTLMPEDAYANLTAEFPVQQDQSYIAPQNMLRMTELTFMLNRLLFSGTYVGAGSRQADLNGNPLLFVRSLADTAPTLQCDAGGTDFTFELANDIQLMDDLDIVGDGSATFRLTGTVSDHEAPRGITKRGTSTVTLAGTLACEGSVVVEAGTFVLDSTASGITEAAGLDVQAGSLFDHRAGTARFATVQLPGGAATYRLAGGTLETAAINGSFTATGGILSPGTSPALVPLTGTYTQLAGGTLHMELGGTDVGTSYDRLAVTGNATLNGTLSAEWINGYTPSYGERFRILTAASISGTFSATPLPALPTGLQWAVHYHATGVELRVGSNDDTDGDFLGDDWERLYWPDLDGTDGGDTDSDNDTFTDYQEWVILTNPRDPGSRLYVSHIDGDSTTMTIQVPTSSGVNYTLEEPMESTTPPNEWQEVSQFPGTGDVVIIPVSPQRAMNTYRVQAERTVP